MTPSRKQVACRADAMVNVPLATATAAATPLNVADRLAKVAARMADAIAAACPRRWSPRYPRECRGRSGAAYATITFAELDADVTRIACGLAAWGLPPGSRLALLVRPGIEFVTLVFALLRAGMVVVLIDPGLGRRNVIRCLADAEPEGFVAVPIAQAGRLCLRRKFPHARWNVTVGNRWFWGGMTFEQLRRPLPAPGSRLPATDADDPAAIIFTSGSTGPPKGVLYTHRMFDTQVSEIQSTYGIEPGGVDLACFPLFALFNAAMGVTTVLPEMDFSRPASADPRKLLTAANDWQVTQAFASPAVWRMLSDHCATAGGRTPTLRQVFSCGAPVPADVLRATLACVADAAQMHTPYGATECLPVATIEAAEVLGETAARTDEGAGVCVGRKFDSIDWQIIRITDEPIATIAEADELPAGEIGELVVRGPQASPQYVTQQEANTKAKIVDGRTIWHRTGDVGYLDDRDRFWYCGRKSHRVVTESATLYTECVESIVNTFPGVRRSALVGVGPLGGQTPVLVIERDLTRRSNVRREHFLDLAKSRNATCLIEVILFHPRLPVDVRHNAKINRELLARWAAKRIANVHSRPSGPSP